MLPPPFGISTLDEWIYVLLAWVALPVGIYAFVHAMVQRSDAFTAADKLSKPAWLGITGGATAVLALFAFGSDGLFLFWLAGLIAVLVYIVDVRSKVTDIQRGPRW